MFEITPQEVQRFVGRLDNLYNELSQIENHHLFTKVIGMDLYKTENLTEEEFQEVASLSGETDHEVKKKCFLLVMNRLVEVATENPDKLPASAGELRRQIQQSIELKTESN